MLLYSYFYRQYGVRRVYNLTAPVLHSTAAIDIPRGSVIHYVGDDVASLGMPGDDLLLQHVNRTILVDYVTQLTHTEGPPRSTFQSVPKMIKDYQRKYRRFRQVKDLSMVWRDDRSILQVNYALLHHLNRYVKSVFSSYFAWKNIQATVWDTVAAMAKASDRPHLIPCRLPTRLPPVSVLQMAEKNFSRSAMAHFTDPESLFLLDMWKWLGNHRDQSLMGKVAEDQFSKINLVWQDSGRWFVLNLGILDSWRRMPSAELAKEAVEDEEDDDTAPGGTLNPLQIQKRFLRLLMFLQAQRGDAEGQVADPQKQIKKADPVKPSRDELAHDAGTRPNAPETKPIMPVLRPAEMDHLSTLDLERYEKQIDTWVDEDLDVLEKFKLPEIPAEGEESQQEERIESTYQAANHTLHESVMIKADTLADAGLLTAAEYRRINKLAESYKTIPDPYGEHESLAHQLEIKPELLKVDDRPIVPDHPEIVDKSMLSSSIYNYTRNYTQNVMPKDITNMVMGIQRAGIAVTGYTIEPVSDAMNAYEAHTVRVAPVNGSPTTIRFRVPKIQEDGTYMADGVRYRMRLQRSDMPIRKVAPDSVSLTSYFAKMSVDRSSKVVNNYPQWLTNQIRARSLAKPGELPEGTPGVFDLKTSDVFDSSLHVPRLYSILSMAYSSFQALGATWFFDYDKRVEYFKRGDYDVVAEAERDGMVMIGLATVRSPFYPHRPILVDKNDTLYQLVPHDGPYTDKDRGKGIGSELKVLGRIEDVLKLEGRAPMEQIDIRIFGKNIPLGIFLAYHVGLSTLCSLLKVKPRIVKHGERITLNDDEYSITFSDETWVFNRENKLAAMVLSGFRLGGNVVRNYRSDIFDKKDIYFNLMEALGLGVRYLREMELVMDMFIDPITAELLKEMKEPTDMVLLLIRAAEMLLTDWSPDETDLNYMRFRGYERIAGAVYTELVKAIRGHQRTKGNNGATIEVPPYAVWTAINQDPAVCLVEESNPIHNLKEKEEVTYSGTGGRSRRTMVKGTRIYHTSDQGAISEATKDSGDTGVTTFLTADPNLINLRGVTKRWDGKVEPTKLMSTSMALAPCADRDDPKRVNFISIQHSSGMSAVGYDVTPLRTGYERVLAHRVDDLFAYTAKEDGVITSVTPKAVTVTYKSGKTRSIELGRRYGTVAGLIMPHSLECHLKEGDKVKTGDLVAYNTNYFKVDPHDSTQALWKAGVMVKTAIMENADTLEDSSIISEKTAERLAAYVTKVREIVVRFDQNIHQLAQVGDEVDVETILCTIEDGFSSNNSLFADESLKTLRLISAYTPRAKYHGQVEKVEVLYNGEIEDMSESLKEITQTSDRHRRALSKQLNKPYTPGAVDNTMHVDHKPLEMDNLVIRVYITTLQPAGVGDKGVVGNQLKTIFGRIMSGKNETESGVPIDAVFSYESIAARIVLSPEIMGTTNTLLRVMSKRVADVYFGRRK